MEEETSLKYSEEFPHRCGDCGMYMKTTKCPNCSEDIGLKYDNEKLRWHLLPFDAVEKIVEIMTYGAKKYKPNNWKLVEPKRYIGALFRHLVAHLKGEEYDEESGYLHLAHMACNALFILWKQIHGEINE